MKNEFTQLSDWEAMQASIEAAERCAALFCKSLQTVADFASQRMRNKPELPNILANIHGVSPSLPKLLESLAQIDSKIRKCLPK